MKITIYELLGLIKDGKDIPEKISYIDTDGFKYVFELENDKNYWCEELGGWIFNNWDIQLILNNEVEILDEEDEFIDIEEIDVALLGQCDNWLRCPTNEVIKQNIELNPYIIDNVRENTLGFQHKINDLIKNQKKIIQALKEKK